MMQNFLKVFLHLVPLNSACGLGIWGRGSQGLTPLHAAAWQGHEVVVERLLEAKAAVDAKEKDGRGLGRGFGEENLLRQWDSCEEAGGMLMVQVLLILHLFCGKCFAKTFGTDILCCSL